MKNKITVYIIACVLLCTPTLNFGMVNPYDMITEKESNTPRSRSQSPIREILSEEITLNLNPTRVTYPVDLPPLINAITGKVDLSLSSSPRNSIEQISTPKTSPRQQSAPIFIAQLNSDDQSDSDSIQPLINLITGSTNHGPSGSPREQNIQSSSGSNSPRLELKEAKQNLNQLSSDSSDSEKAVKSKKETIEPTKLTDLAKDIIEEMEQNERQKHLMYTTIGVATLAGLFFIIAHHYNKLPDAFIKLLNSILPNRCAL